MSLTCSNVVDILLDVSNTNLTSRFAIVLYGPTFHMVCYIATFDSLASKSGNLYLG